MGVNIARRSAFFLHKRYKPFRKMKTFEEIRAIFMAKLCSFDLELFHFEVTAPSPASRGAAELERRGSKR
jgi:hypothetical protein